MSNVSPADASPAAPADSSLTTAWPAPAESHEPGPAVGSNLDTIRDILFGARSRDLEQRISALEAGLEATAASLRTEIAGRFAALDTFARQEFAKVAETTHALDQAITTLDTRSTTNERELHDQLVEQATRLSADLRQSSASLASALERAVADLRHEKTDRAALAALLTELAAKLGLDVAPPAHQ